MLSRTSIQASDVNPNVELRHGPFQIISPTLNPFNRELWLNSRVEIELPANYSGTILSLYYINLNQISSGETRYSAEIN